MRQQPAFRGIERPVPDMPYVNLPEQWIGLPHALKHRHCSDPKRNAQADSPPTPQTECEANCGKHRDQHQFAIPAEDLVRSVRRLVDHDLSRPVGSLHGLHHRRVDAECAGKQRGCENQHGNHQPDHAGAASELG